MRFEIEVAGRARNVEITRQGKSYLVKVDGQPQAVDIAKSGHSWSLLIGPAKAGPHDDSNVAAGNSEVGADDANVAAGNSEVGADDANVAAGDSEVGAGFSRPARSYEVAFVPRPGGEMLVYVDGHPVMTRRAGLVRSDGRGSDGRVGPQPIVAPMPGRILKVLVKTGDAVAARQGLVVVEAMKMENELRSPKAGTVTEIRVAEGATVEAHTVLMVVE